MEQLTLNYLDMKKVLLQVQLVTGVDILKLLMEELFF